MDKVKSPWLPPHYVEYENANWQGEGARIVLRVKKNGTVIQSSEFFPDEARRVIELLQAAGVVTEELQRGVPEKPRFKR
ncbi:hypothetical protein OIU34_00465 [Pararhizobium sp. BT-229]|uniref:hypothetical protein n=1 Tax=Pararhizobium sp. BT-229 TaxID=2986923 RepID=UPI0021F7B215|nr:hypothetical protein [Pararhizobium sp. BT-229]MCV9960358.1 hypothetical protein [Pararhizobium sp. BT-229]